MEEKKLGLLPLTMLVIGSLVGGGIFNLMKDMGSVAGVVPILIAWAITGIGMGALVICFQNLTEKRPDLNAGIFSYAKEGFGNFMGFNSAWGYWTSAWLGNVAYGALLFGSLSYFFDIFGDGNNIYSIVGASIVLWSVHALILRGVHTASFINTVVTFAKLIPLAIFIVAILLAFKLDIFTADIYGTGGPLDWGSIFAQVGETMGVAVWVFIGIEGAVVFSGRAKNKSDIGKATVLGLLSIIAIYILVTVVSLGVMTRPELSELKTPAMAYLLKSIVGEWGAALINLGVIIAVSGAWLAWTMFAAELPYQAAKEGSFPKFFAQENENKAPVNALLFTNSCIQLFLITLLFTSQAYEFSFALASSAILIPYLFTALYQWKFSVQEPVGTKGRNFNIFIGVLATVYGIYLVYASGIDNLLLTMLLYAPGILVYRKVQKEENKPLFVGYEAISAVVIVALAVWALYRIATGSLVVG